MSTLNYAVSSLDQQSLPAGKRLVYSLRANWLISALLGESFFCGCGTEAKIQAHSLKRNEGKITTNKVKTLAYISDRFVSVVTEK